MPLAFYLDFATKQEGLRRFIDSKGLLTPRIGSLSCRPLPPSDNKGRDLAVIKQILHGYILSERKIRDPMIDYRINFYYILFSNSSRTCQMSVMVFSSTRSLVEWGSTIRGPILAIWMPG